MDIETVIQLNLLQKVVEKFEQQSKRLDSEKGNQNSRNFECVIGLLSANISKDNIDQVILVDLGKLAKKDMERLQSAGVTARLIQKALLSRAKNI